MEAMLDDKQVLSIQSSAHLHQTGLGHVLIDQTIIRGPNDLCRLISPTPFVLWFKNCLLFRAHVFVATSDSHRVLACASYTMFSVWKGFIYDRSNSLSMALKKANGCHFPRIFWEFLKKIKRTALFSVSQATNYVLFRRWSSIGLGLGLGLGPVQRSRCRKNQTKNWHGKMPDFDHLVDQ
jgi:hypothetical protein